MSNGLELPEASNAEVVDVVFDAEAPRRKTPNNHGIAIYVFIPTSRVRFRINAIQALSAPNMVQQHHYRCL